MSNTPNTTLLLLLCACGLWLILAGVAAFDLNRRRPPMPAFGLWLAAILLLPLVGAAAYGLARAMESFGGPPPSPEAPSYRYTQAKPPRRDSALGHTLPAADLLQATRAARPADGDPDGPPAYALVVLSGAHVGEQFPLTYFPARLGRGPEADFRLDRDLNVSRLHAEIFLQAGVLRLRDLNSSHGTQVNGYSIETKALDLGDQILVGSSLLQLQPIGLQPTGLQPMEGA